MNKCHRMYKTRSFKKQKKKPDPLLLFLIFNSHIFKKGIQCSIWYSHVFPFDAVKFFHPPKAISVFVQSLNNTKEGKNGFSRKFFWERGHPQPINTKAHGTRIAEDQASLMLPQPGPPRNLDNIMITFMKISIP